MANKGKQKMKKTTPQPEQLNNNTQSQITPNQLASALTTALTSLFAFTLPNQPQPSQSTPDDGQIPGYSGDPAHIPFPSTGNQSQTAPQNNRKRKRNKDSHQPNTRTARTSTAQLRGAYQQSQDIGSKMPVIIQSLLLHET